MSEIASLYEALQGEISRVLVGHEELTEALTITLLSEGHVLLEGVPGVAKTTAANLFAVATGLSFNRIQMTPDVMPADITGTHVYQESTGEFTLRKGPIFSNIVVADEINRATPKTQSALLEGMQEKQVSIEGETLSLPTPFMVIGTQNPIEMEGTFALPEAQRDRFMMKLSVDLLERELESDLLEQIDKKPDLGLPEATQAVSPDQLLAARQTANDVYVDPLIKSYILDLVEETRTTPDTDYGVSHRGSIALLRTSKARAAIRGREYVIPDDVKSLAQPTLAHRLVLSTDAELSDVTTHDVVQDVLSRVKPPSGDEFQVNPRAVADGDGSSASDEQDDQE